MTWRLADREIRSVLLTRLRYLGDVVMATAVARVLRAGDPDLRVGFLCEAAHAPVLWRQPDIDRLHILGARRRGADARVRGGGGEGGRGTLALAREIRAAGYDLAIDLFFNPRSAWLLRLAGCPLRIGGARGWRRRLYTHTVTPEQILPSHPDLRRLAPGGLGDHLSRLGPLRHAERDESFPVWAERTLSPGDLAPRLATEAWRARRPESPTAVPAADAPSLVLAPGATWSSKEWPLDMWRGLIAKLLSRTGHRLLVIVPPGAAERWRPLAADLPSARGGVLPPASLSDVLGVLARADGVVSVDGGIMHAAVALGVPTVGLFGPTDPGAWFPYEHLGPYRVLATRPSCHPCHLHDCDEFICLPALTVASVLEALEAVVGPDASAGVVPR